MAAGKPGLAACREKGCASESSLSFHEVVQQVMSTLYLFSFPSGNTARRYCGQVADSQVCSSLGDLLLVPGGSSRLDFQGTDHSRVCWTCRWDGPNNPMGPSQTL